jgi:hypothetical protein
LTQNETPIHSLAISQNLSAVIFDKNVTAPYYKKGFKTLKTLLWQEAIQPSR